nr:hypothetical protein Iba_chr14fCG7270 [Ipomoea batatas]
MKSMSGDAETDQVDRSLQKFREATKRSLSRRRHERPARVDILVPAPYQSSNTCLRTQEISDFAGDIWIRNTSINSNPDEAPQNFFIFTSHKTPREILQCVQFIPQCESHKTNLPSFPTIARVLALSEMLASYAATS